jgi:hypothetical protein
MKTPTIDLNRFNGFLDWPEKLLKQLAGRASPQHLDESECEELSGILQAALHLPPEERRQSAEELAKETDRSEDPALQLGTDPSRR